MRTRAAVIYEMEKPEPYAQTLPLVVEEVELDPPGPGEPDRGTDPRGCVGAERPTAWSSPCNRAPGACQTAG